MTRPPVRASRFVAVVALALLVAGCGGDRSDRVDGPGAGRDEARHVLGGAELMRADFETGDLRQWDGEQRVADDRIQVVRDPVDQGEFSGRFEVRDGDNPIGFGDRAEVQLATDEGEGDDRWYAWSTMFDPTFPDSDAWQVVTQWHSSSDGPPPLAFYVENEEYTLQTNPYDPDGDVSAPVAHWSAPLNRGTWRHIRLHVVWSADPERGLIELWVDGERATPPISTQTLRPGEGVYFKQGYYRRSGEPQTGIVYHDAFRMSEAAPPS
jgi:hypothetical protein